MDDNGYDFVIMIKGMKSLVSELILEAQGSFENDRRNSIRVFKVSGVTIRRKLYASDKKERYFHIYYDDGSPEDRRIKPIPDNFSVRIRNETGEQGI